MRYGIIFISFLIFFSVSVNGASIIVDGDLSEWTNGNEPLTNVADPGGSGDAGGGDIEILTNGIASDNNNLYFYFHLNTIVSDWHYFEIYIDTDNNSSTGGNQAIDGTSFSSCGLEKAFRLNSPLNDKWGNLKCSWSGSGWNTDVNDYVISHSNVNNIIEIKIPFSEIGISPGSTIGIKFYTSDGLNKDHNPDTGEILFTIPLSPPQNVNAVSISNNKIIVYWEEVPGVTSYTIYRATSLSGPTNKIGGTTTTVYTDSTVVNAFTSDYYYWVKAYKNGNSSPYSEYALNTQDFASITVDGNLSEWTQTRRGIVIDVDGASDTWGTYEILTNNIGNDDSYLYCTFKVGATLVNDVKYNVYIDIDADETTGTTNRLPGSINPGIPFMGAEYGYQFNPNGNTITFYSNKNGTWTNLSTSAQAGAGVDTIELAFPLSELKIKSGDFIKILFRTESPWTATDHDENNDTSEILYCIVGGIIPPAPAPSQVHALVIDNNKIKISWDMVPPASGYKLYRNTSNDTNTAILIATLSSSTTYYIDTSVSSALTTKYYYWIKSTKTGADDSGFSSVAVSSPVLIISSCENLSEWSTIEWGADPSSKTNISTSQVAQSNASIKIYAVTSNSWHYYGIRKSFSSFQDWTAFTNGYILLYVRSSPTNTGKIQIGLYDDDNGALDKNWNADDYLSADSAIPYTNTVWQLIQIPLSSFVDANNTYGNDTKEFDKIECIDIVFYSSGSGITDTYWVDYVALSTIAPYSFGSETPQSNSVAYSVSSVKVTASNGVKNDSYTFDINYTNTFLPTGGNISYSSPQLICSCGPLPEGTNTVFANAIAEDNLPYFTKVWRFTVVFLPEIKNLTPTNNSHQVSTNTNITFNVVDNQQVVSNLIFVKINGETVLSNGSFRPGWNGPASAITRIGDVTNYQVVIDKTSAFGPNTAYTLFITAEDNLGGKVTNISVFYTKDTIPPVISLISPAPFTPIHPSSNIYFELDDNLYINSNSIVVRIGTNQLTTNYKTAFSNGIFQPGFSGSIVNDGTGGYNLLINPDNDFIPGEKVFVYIYAEDYGNNSAESNFYYNVQSDFSAPVISVSPQPGVFLKSVDITISVQDESPYWIYYTLDGTDPLNSATAVSNYNSSVNITITTDTVLKCYARDIYNNQSSVYTYTYEIINQPEQDAEVYNNYADLSSPDTKIRFVINKDSQNVRIKIYDIRGHLLYEISAGDCVKGSIIEWDGRINGRKADAGLYIVWIKGNNIDIKRKIIIVK